MVNSYALGFVAVAAAAVIGADYVVQSKANGSYPGGYAISDYAGGLSQRAREALAAADKARRQRVAAREHLPEAVAGSERRVWERDASGDEALQAGMTLLERRAFGAALKQARKAAREEVWEYVRGEETFRLSARFEPRAEGEGAGAVTAFVAPGVDVTTARLEPFGVIKGVPFFRVIDGATGAGGDPAGPVMLQGFLGREAAIGVYAERPFAELAQALEAIDYDSLNAMLEAPVAHVGSQARPMAEAERAAFLQAAAHVRAAMPGAAETGRGEKQRETLGGGQALAGSKSVDGARRLSAGRDEAGNTPRRLRLAGGRTCLREAGKLCD